MPTVSGYPDKRLTADWPLLLSDCMLSDELLPASRKLLILISAVIHEPVFPVRVGACEFCCVDDYKSGRITWALVRTLLNRVIRELSLTEKSRRCEDSLPAGMSSDYRVFSDRVYLLLG